MTTTAYFTDESCDLEDFKALTGQSLDATAVPLADGIEKNIPIYDMARHRAILDDPAKRQTLMAEWARNMLTGSGVIVLKAAYADTGVIDEASEIYLQIIADEKSANATAADHFAASGANDRIWNSLEKLCRAAPEVYLRYFSNTSIAAASEAWLGPNYQITAQVNLVRPGGAAQTAHRDYHLGFQTAEDCASYPAHVHDLSPVMTLQGGIAHCDMPLEAGPTKLLPFSQAYRPGYMAYRRKDFQDYSDANFVQVALEKGDAIFFSPAIFHAAGANSSADIQRMVNLLQVGSAFGRTLENIDRRAMSKQLYPHAKASALPAADLAAAIAATAEGYPFPTNLDTDPPVGGLAPESQAQLFHRALAEDMSVDDFVAALDAIHAKQQS